MSLWPTIHAERAALADDLADLDERQWRQGTLCASWSVEEVVAHLTAAASTGRLRWLVSIAGAGLRPDVHNRRRLVEHLGADPGETLERFRRVVRATTAASGHLAAWLGEVVVHAQDIRRPLGIGTVPSPKAVGAVARFFAERDFAVPSKSAIKGLRLAAEDGPFAVGDGPLVTGSTLALTMAMAGRAGYCDELAGEGVAVLRGRCADR